MKMVVTFTWEVEEKHTKAIGDYTGSTDLTVANAAVESVGCIDYEDLQYLVGDVNRTIEIKEN
jgi:hypothetical protein